MTQKATSAEPIARLKVTMDDVEPAVLRRIEVPYAITLADLHLVLQVAIGWTNSHLYEFALGRTDAWGVPDPDWPDGRQSAAKARLSDVLADAGKKGLTYVYDFGDDWRHKIKVERVFDAVPDVAYPRLVEAKGCCPPEDVGGPFGYADFLDIIADPKHERHAELLEWSGGAFDPDVVDVAAIERELAGLGDFLTKRRRAGKKASRANAK